MDKSIKIILAAVAVIMLLNLLFSFFGINANLNKALKKMEESEKKLDNSIKEINASRSKLDSVRTDLTNFKDYIRDIQGRVEILDLERRANQEKFRKQKDTIQNRLKELYKDVETTGEDLPLTEALN